MGTVKRKSPGKTALSAAFLLLAAAGLVVLCLPFGASGVWRQIFSAFGLKDFSACADASPFSVHVLDVGKADSILIQCGGKNMLVDGGTADRGESVVRYLKRRGVDALEAVVNTHPDEDHVGGLKDVISAFPVGGYYEPLLPRNLIPQTDEYRTVESALHKAGLTPAHPLPGEKFSLGGAAVRVLGPVRTGTDTNNNSIVLRVDYGKTSFLLMGDAEKEEEQDLLAGGETLSADVLKVGHHGSSTSTSEEFLRAVRPEYAAVSVGNDSNGLPKRDVLERLAASGAEVFRTDVSGTLIFLSDGEKITVVTEK